MRVFEIELPKSSIPPTVGTLRPWCFIISGSVSRSVRLSLRTDANDSEAARKSSASKSHSGIACSSGVFGACKTPQFVDQFAVGAAIGGADSHIDPALKAGTFGPCSHRVRHRYSNNPGRVNRIASGKFRKQGKIAVPREQHFHAMRNADSSDPGIMYYRCAYSWTLNETF